MKKIIALLTLILFVLGIATACSSSTTTPAPSATTTKSQTTNTTAAATEPEREYYQPKILVSMSINPNIVLSNENEIGKVLEEKFNIVFEYIPLTGDLNEKVNLLLATGDYPELIGMTGVDNIRKYIDAGAAISLESYIENAPNFQREFKEQIGFWRNYSGKNEVCHWESGVGGTVGERFGYIPGDIVVRSDALEKQGWPTLTSASDWIPFLKQAMQDFPETDGKKSIGLTSTFAEPWGLQGIAGIGYEKGEHLTGAAGNNAVIWNHTESTFVDYFLCEEALETIRWFNALYREGILDEESFTDLYQQTVDKVKSGQALSIWYSGWAAGEANQAFRDAGKPEMQYVSIPFQLDSQASTNQKRASGIAYTNFSDIYCITKNAEHPERIFEVVEFALSDEGQILLQSGIEGITYNIVDGKRVPTDEYLANWSSFEWKMGVGMAWEYRYLPSINGLASDGVQYNMNSPEIEELLRDERANEAIDKMDLNQWYDRIKFVFIDSNATSVTLDSTSEESRIETRLIDFRVKAYAQLILAETEAEYESILANLIAEYKKLEPERVIDAYNEGYRKNKEASGG